LISGESHIEENDKVIDVNFAFRGIEDFFRDYPSRGVRFYSAGEATSEMFVFKRIVEYLKAKKDPNLYLELQTNGYFDEDCAEWIEDNMDFVWVSFDGLPEFQDENRPTKGGAPTSDTVVKNMRKFGFSDKVEIGCRVTLTRNMIDKQKEMIDYLLGLNIKYISLERAHCSTNNLMFTEEDSDPLYYAEKFLEVYNYAKEKGVFCSHFNMVNFDEPSRFFCRACVPYPHLTTDGYVSCCDMAAFGNPRYMQFSMPDLIYGKYDNANDTITYDERKIYNLRQRNADTLSKTICQDCDIVKNCVGGCMGQSYITTGKICSISEWDCVVTKYLAKYLPLNKGLYPLVHS